MAPSQSNLGVMLWHPMDLPLEEIPYFAECCSVLVTMEISEDPEEYVHTCNLFEKYLHQELKRMTGQELWLCLMSYNISEGTAWPGLKDPVEQALELLEF